jgi:phosphoribosylpyrophosphate synthetase
VPQSRIQGFFKFLFDNYYSEQKVAGLIESDYMFVTNPNDGAFISIFNGTEQMYWRHSKSNIN